MINYLLKSEKKLLCKEFFLTKLFFFFNMFPGILISPTSKLNDDIQLDQTNSISIFNN